MRPNEASYRLRGLRISTVEQLGEVLETPVSELAHLAQNTDLYYHSFTRLKKDGTPRGINAPKSRLRRVLRRIKSQIFDRVHYASFLHGGIRRRSTKSNASVHIGARVLICLDVSKFYDHITAAEVRLLFQQFFRFPEPVSDLLARLCTRNGVVAQGSHPSSFISQLVFWKEEPRLVVRLAAEGIRYTRFIDDIAMSSTADLTGSQIGAAIGRVRVMAGKHGLILKKRKEQISRTHGSRGARGHGVPSGMCVTGFRLGSKRLAIPKSYRAAVRSEAHMLTNTPDAQHGTVNFRKQVSSAAGRINYVQQTHPGFCNQYLSELKAVLKSAGPGAGK